MMNTDPLTITLESGYTDPKGVTHRDVTFGKPLLGADLFAVDEDVMARLETQRRMLLLRRQITKFGDLMMPTAIMVLLKLDIDDIGALEEAGALFQSQCLDGREPEVLPEGKVKLAVGYDLNGLVYDVAEFGGRLTGMDLVAADKANLRGLRRECYLTAKQITRLSQSDGASELPGPFDADLFGKLEMTDILVLREGVDAYRESFRSRRGNLQAADGKDSVLSDERNRTVRSGDTVVAAGAL